MIFHSYVSLPEGNSCEIPMFGTSSQKSHPRHPQISHRSCLFSVHRIGTWRPQVPRWDRFGKSPRRPFRCSGDIKKKEWQKSNVTSVFSIPKSHPKKIFITSILLHCMVPNNWIYPLHWPTSMIELSLRLTYRKTHGFGKSFTNNGGFSRPNYDSLQEDTIQKKKNVVFPRWDSTGLPFTRWHTFLELFDKVLMKFVVGGSAFLFSISVNLLVW